MSKIKFNVAVVYLLTSILTVQSEPAFAGKFVETDPDGTKHIRAPFVHVDVRHNYDGTKNVNVKAPFVKVHHPPGTDNAQVTAPFTKVKRNEDGSPKVSAPFTKVNRADDGSTKVRAPLTKVDHASDGATRVKAPFTHVAPTTERSD